MNEREFNAAMSAILESVGPEVYNAIIDEANNNLDTIDDLTMDEAVALAAVTLSDDGVISEAAYGTVDAVMEAYENQMVLENLASALDEDTYETIVNAAGQVMQECGCDISEALDAVLDEAGIEYGSVDEGFDVQPRAIPNFSPKSSNAPAPKAPKATTTSNAQAPQATLTSQEDYDDYMRQVKANSDGNGGSLGQQLNYSANRAKGKKGFKLPNVGGAMAKAGSGYVAGLRGKDKDGNKVGALQKWGTRGGTALALAGGATAATLGVRHIMKKRKERKEAEARAAAERAAAEAEARKPLNRLKAAVSGKGKKAANEAATNAMAYLMECSGIGA